MPLSCLNAHVVWFWCLKFGRYSFQTRILEGRYIYIYIYIISLVYFEQKLHLLTRWSGLWDLPHQVVDGSLRCCLGQTRKGMDQQPCLPEVGPWEVWSPCSRWEGCCENGQEDYFQVWQNKLLWDFPAEKHPALTLLVFLNWIWTTDMEQTRL